MPERSRATHSPAFPVFRVPSTTCAWSESAVGSLRAAVLRAVRAALATAEKCSREWPRGARPEGNNLLRRCSARTFLAFQPWRVDRVRRPALPGPSGIAPRAGTVRRGSITYPSIARWPRSARSTQRTIGAQSCHWEARRWTALGPAVESGAPIDLGQRQRRSWEQGR